MTDEKWEDLIFMIKEKFGIDERRTEDLKEGVGNVETIEFKGPLGKMKLERISRPRVIDKKTQYSRRIGGAVNVDYIYSDTEKVHRLKVYKWNENQNNWEEIKAETMLGS